MHKSLIFRKSQQLFKQIEKKYSRRGNSNAIIVNSFPKSGTHLLYQLFDNMDNMKYYYSFIASMPSVSQKELSSKKTIKKLANICPGEIVRAHMFYNKDHYTSIRDRGIIHYFIFRDPRDIVISDANYLYDMNRFHRLHKYYRKIHSIDDRIMFSILGNKYLETPVNYLDIGQRFEKYKGWLTSKNTYSIKYEDLVGKRRIEEISKIMEYWAEQSDQAIDLSEAKRIAISNINPEESHTFRQGGTQKWKQYFNAGHKKIFKEVAGSLLIELGYEKDMNW